jgi:hypothetical protein
MYEMHQILGKVVIGEVTSGQILSERIVFECASLTAPHHHQITLIVKMFAKLFRLGVTLVSDAHRSPHWMSFLNASSTDLGGLIPLILKSDVGQLSTRSSTFQVGRSYVFEADVYRIIVERSQRFSESPIAPFILQEQ